jgi:DNA-binding LytR/AlgR family response regulator
MTPPPTAILADDEQPLLAYLRAALARSWPELQIRGEAANGSEALQIIEDLQPDIAFLDIQMPGISGIEVARRVTGRCHVVFVTAYEEFAIQAFEAAAADYLLKPVDDARLAATVERLKSQLTSGPGDASALLETLNHHFRPPSYLEFLQVQQRQDIILLPVEEVQYFRSSDKYTLAITPSDEWVIRTPLKELEEQLDPTRFWKIHRNSIVRVGAIGRVSRDEDGQLLVHLRDSDRTVAVSRSFASRFRQM